MTEATPKTSTLVVTGRGALTDEQRLKLREAIAAQLPPDVGVLVFDTGWTVQHIGVVVGHVGPELELVAGELQPDLTSVEILAELKALRVDLTAQSEIQAAIQKNAAESLSLLRRLVQSGEHRDLRLRCPA